MRLAIIVNLVDISSAVRIKLCYIMVLNTREGLDNICLDKVSQSFAKSMLNHGPLDP